MQSRHGCRLYQPLAALPLLPIIGARSAPLGGLVVESVTNRPGIGLQAFYAVTGPDVPLVMGRSRWRGPSRCS